ncbi:MAG: hypothetical protein NC212_10690 [Staphylococcus sp.]|nr:hypothetical protein [Staphylococcus sp.]
MKKTFLSIAVFLAAMTGVSASAQSQSPQNCTNPNTTCSQKSCAPKESKCNNPFAGLNLTEQQQSQLKALNCPNVKGKQCKQQSSKDERQAQKQQKAQQKQQARKDYLAQVKSILTPEQYVQFLENSYLERGARQKPHHGHAAKAHGNKKGGKDQAIRGNKNRENCNKNRQCAKGQNQQNSAAVNDDGSFYIDNGLIKVFPYHAQR